MALTKLKLPLGSATSRLTLTQTEVDTLIRVAKSSVITQKQVTGYVFKSEITDREYYYLTEVLGLNVAYDTKTADTWTLTSDKATLADGETATLTIGGGLPLSEFTLEMGTVTVEFGSVTQEAAAACFTLSGNTLTFDEGSLSGEYAFVATVRAYPVWDTTDVKTVTLKVSTVVRTVVINPASASAELEHHGDVSMIEDYLQRCKCYVFNANGSKKAEIKSATFTGTYANGMTGGKVVFADDTEALLSDLNAAGCNFMVLRPALYIWSGTENGDEVLKCSGAYDLLGEAKKVFPKKYIGMFKAFAQNGVLKSQPGRVPTGQQTIATFQSQARTGNGNYGLWNYSDWCKENALHLAYFANTNYEANVGVGRIEDYDNVRNIVTGYTLPLAGKYRCGTAMTTKNGGATVNCLNFFGIEGMGEQIWEFVIGFRHDGSKAYIWDENSWSETHAADRTFNLGVTSASGVYIQTIIAGQHFDLLPRATGASSSTGMCDGHWASTNGRLLFVGGRAAGGSLCGLSCSNANNDFSDSYAIIGARLAFYGEPATVAGSELVASL
jgi:hypothetical protein